MFWLDPGPYFKKGWIRSEHIDSKSQENRTFLVVLNDKNDDIELVSQLY